MTVCAPRDVCCALLLLGLVVGCGDSDPLGRKAISGTVTLNDSPVEQGNISFDPEGSAAATSSGAVIIAGKYSIEQKVGLPPGKYRVRINIPKPGAVAAEDTMTMPGEEEPPPAELAPPEWNTNSTQSIEVKAEGPFVFDFDVKGKK